MDSERSIDMQVGIPQIYHQLGTLTGEIRGMRSDMQDLKAAEEERRKRDLKLERRLSKLEAAVAQRPQVGFRDMDRKIKIVVAGTSTGMVSLGLLVFYALIKAMTSWGVHP